MIEILSGEEIELVLQSNHLGRIGCNDGNRTYIVPINYVYDGKCIVAHAIEGRKISMMRSNPEVCFEVDEVKSFSHWKSVVLWGNFQELVGERDRYYAMKLLTAHLMHIKFSHPAETAPVRKDNGYPVGTPAAARPVIYRIHIIEKTGRYEVA